jgi:ABC-type multidrug transport system fused ATPase/permease subunit
MDHDKQNIDFKYNFKVYWRLLKNYKFLFFGLLFIGLVMAATITATKFLFKIIIDSGTEFANNIIGKDVFIDSLILVIFLYIGIYLLRAVGQWIKIHMINRLDAKLMMDLKRIFFNHIVHLSHNFHTTHKTGSLISRLMRGSGSIERMTDIMVFNITPLIFQIIVVGASILYFNWISALTLLITVIAFIIYSFLIQQRQRKANIIVNATEDVEKANISDFLTNIDSIKYFGKENKVKRKFRKLANNSKQAMIHHWDYFRWLDLGHTIILALGLFFIMYFPIMDLLNGKATIGTVVFIFTVYADVTSPLYSFVHAIRGYYRSMADFESLFQYGKIHNEIKDTSRAKKLKIKNPEIEFKDVSFGYVKQRGLLDKFSLKIGKNKKIAFVGHSGSGKSTLVKLLYRLYDVDDGKILIDKTDIKKVKQESLRSELSIVPQECILFDDTIFNNIAFSNPEARKEEVFKAIKFAQLDKVIRNFPQKEKTIVGERGVKLSGGEKQRVSIARAILANKKILVLDEATSALDSETESEIQKDLEKLMEGRTSIIIAHRLSTIMKADTIVVLKEGKIVQKGTHNELIKKSGEYKKLWNLQRGGYLE